MATPKNAPTEHADEEPDDPTLGGALPDPTDDSLNGRLQSGRITYKEWVHEATAVVVVGP